MGQAPDSRGDDRPVAESGMHALDCVGIPANAPHNLAARVVAPRGDTVDETLRDSAPRALFWSCASGGEREATLDETAERSAGPVTERRATGPNHSANGGTRTPTGEDPHEILSLARLPIPPRSQAKLAE